MHGVTRSHAIDDIIMEDATDVSYVCIYHILEQSSAAQISYYDTLRAVLGPENNRVLLSENNCVLL